MQSITLKIWIYLSIINLLFKYKLKNKQYWGRLMPSILTNTTRHNTIHILVIIKYENTRNKPYNPTNKIQCARYIRPYLQKNKQKYDGKRFAKIHEKEWLNY